jgi:hypothetical protein
MVCCFAISLACARSFAAEATAGQLLTKTATLEEGAASLDGVETLLARRGLLRAAVNDRADPVGPPTSVEVDEYVQHETASGADLAQIKAWSEPLGKDLLHVEVTTYPDGQRKVAFWVLPKQGPGCSAFGTTMYNREGKDIQRTFWRNDAGLKIAGAADFPRDLYPDPVPPVGFLRAVDALDEGAAGKLHQQISPYGYAGLNVWVKDLEPVSVPAGNFSAYRVAMRVDVSSFLPSWPSFALKLIEHFAHEDTLYFESEAPHRFIKGEGDTSFVGPEATTELVRFYTAGASQASAQQPHIGTGG